MILTLHMEGSEKILYKTCLQKVERVFLHRDSYSGFEADRFGSVLMGCCMYAGQAVLTAALQAAGVMSLHRDRGSGLELAECCEIAHERC